MRRIEIRLTGKTWEEKQTHIVHAVQLNSAGDLVLMGVTEKPVGEHEGVQVYATKLQHGYSAGTWAEFRDAGELPDEAPRTVQ
jgi:hypothetical protein